MIINPRKIDLRWRFDFKDGRRPRYGIWNHPGRPDDSVQLINTANLARAAIEQKCIFSNKIKIIAECDGEDFCLFRYRAAARTMINMRKFQGHIPTRTQVVGLILVTRDFECEVLDDGSPPKLLRRSEWDKKQNYIAYGR